MSSSNSGPLQTIELEASNPSCGSCLQEQLVALRQLALWPHGKKSQAFCETTRDIHHNFASL